MANLTIEQRLLHYFMAMGAQQGEPNPAIPGLSLDLGKEKINVVILSNDAYSQRGRIIDAILELTALRTKSNLLYLAAPRLLGTAIDAAVFRSHGIGLLLFDDRRIEELVAPQATQPPQQAETFQPSDTNVLTEISMLRSMYIEMQRNILKLREELKDFRQTVNSASDPAQSTQRGIIASEPVFAVQGDQLPSFFTNNPWLDLLSKRGRDGESIAA